MGNIGTPELIIGLIVVMVLFGAKRLPDAARGIGQSLKIFKNEVQSPAPRDEPAEAAVVADEQVTDPPTTRA